MPYGAQSARRRTPSRRQGQAPQALPGIRRAAGEASAMAANEALGEGIGTRLTPPPPFRGALPSAQPIAAPSIAPDAPLGSIAHRLLDDTDGAIPRQTLLQVASLPDRADASGNPVDPSAPFYFIVTNALVISKAECISTRTPAAFSLVSASFSA